MSDQEVADGIARINRDCPQLDRIVIDFNYRRLDNQSLAAPRHDSSSSGASTTRQEDYRPEEEDFSPQEEDDDDVDDNNDDDDDDDEEGLSPTERWRAPQSSFPILHENPDETHAGAWPYYDHEYAAIQPTMEHGHFYGDQFENDWVPDARYNIPVGYAFIEGLGLEYHAEEGYFEDQNGNRIWQ